MPTLQWVGKEKVVNHHHDVPFRLLDKQYSFVANEGTPANSTGNRIIHGDNLEALKSLLPEFEGRVNCIYIDPPYNTGNEGWIYNDNVNDPKLKKWLGQVVGKDGEDLSRHDKWLCMMYPRLKLLHRLLANDGAIFISIDDNEQSNLRLVLDEIFGANCFVSNISWQRNYSTRNDSKGIPVEVEHLLVYSKQSNWNPRKLERTAEMDAKYKNPDNDYEAWRSGDAFAPGGATHQVMVYAVQHPFTGKFIYPTTGNHWRYQQDEVLNIFSGWTDYELRDLDDAGERARVCGLAPGEVRSGVLGLALRKPLSEARADAEAVYKRGQWPKFYFTKEGMGGVSRKTYLDAVGGSLPTNYWGHELAGHTDEAKKEIRALFDGRVAFDTPKPTRLIERILAIATKPGDLILDSFAGSGTTAHAILKMNANNANETKRRFILCETMDYAETVTAERVRRVMNGYGEGAKAVPGTGGGFDFYTVGPCLFDEDQRLNEEVGESAIRDYVAYTEGIQPEHRWGTDNPVSRYALGASETAMWLFLYERSRVTSLDMDFLGSLNLKAHLAAGNTRPEQFIVYADKCALDADFLFQHGITFKRIPRDITKF